MRATVFLVLVGSLAGQCPSGVSQSFDGAGLGVAACNDPNAGVYPAGWTDGGGGQPWRVNTGATPSAGTGPNGDHTTGSGNYMYCEASNCSMVSHILVSPCADTTVGAATLSFWYYMDGATVGPLEVQESDGAGGWTTVFGPLSGGQGAMWVQVTAPLTARVDAQVRFMYTTGAGFDGDAAIDDVVFGTPTSEFEQNGAGSSFDLDGVQAVGPFGPAAITNTCVNGMVTANVASTGTGLPWELAIAFSPVVPASYGGFVTPNGQVVNVPAFSPSTLWWVGAITGNPAAPNLNVPYAGNLSQTFSAGSVAPLTVSFQQVNGSASHPDGFELSQAAELNVSAGPAFPQPGPTTDDSSVTIDFGCSIIPFYGTLLDRLFVSSNGRVLLGGPDPDWSPTQAEILSDNGFVGYWSDLSPQVGGNITINETSPGVYSVDYITTPYYLEPLAQNTFSVVFDVNTGNIRLDNLTGIVDNPLTNTSSSAGDVQILGMTLGSAGATDPGPVVFTVGGSGVPTQGTDAIYDLWPGGLGRCASLVNGVNQVVFLPAGNSYVYMSL